MGESSVKIAIIGYCGAGKSTLARKLADYYGCAVLHLDHINFDSGWVERSTEAKIPLVSAVLREKSWVIDGNYAKVLYEQRMHDADQIIFLNFNRFDCLWRVIRRYLKYKGKTRPDMAPGCNEKLDWKFISWVLWKGRSKKERDRYRWTLQHFGDKTVVLRNQRQIDRFLCCEIGDACEHPDCM